MIYPKISIPRESRFQIFVAKFLSFDIQNDYLYAVIKNIVSW